MKNSIFFIAAATLALLSTQSCKKDNNLQSPSAQQEKVTVTLSVNNAIEVKSSESASVTDANEKKINNVQYFVFNGTLLEAYANSPVSPLTLTLTTGTKQIYAFVNCDNYSQYTTLSQIQAQVIDLADNAVSDLMMFGHSTVSVVDESPIVVDVRRFVSRVVVKQITKNFESSALASLEFKIKKIYLTNAAGTINLGATAAPSKWYNLGSFKNEVPNLLSDEMDVEIRNAASHATSYYYYTFPNNNEEHTTRLVIQATVGGLVTYYPIDLPALESNKSYEFGNILIKRPGTDDPDVPVTRNVISFSLNVIDWQKNVVNEYVI